MEVTALSIGKSALSGALSYAKSADAEEVALQLGVQRDKAFITDKLEMMQSFLMVAHDEQGEHNKVVRTWVKQWRIPRTVLDRRHVAKKMKELRAKVEDMSHRNVRYRLIDRGSKPANSSDLTTTTAAMFGVDEARRHATNQHQSGLRLDLAQLIFSDKKDLGSYQIGVIGVWGTSGTVGHTSIIFDAYENPNVKAEGEKIWHELAHEYNECVSKKRHLIVLAGLSTIEEWQQIKACFPENKQGSHIIVSTELAC
ncbi:hypothetical protein CFC21_090482 [Triticum aestivum]|uniref:Disease resistance N-terminal domain-containing protein n=2 Tax=Triticum aestivum TaxID=4565 RepID=A0A3B6PVS4_WHEAT|nr:hypothetical protein CFC21_090482 [Triticum aestivum]